MGVPVPGEGSLVTAPLEGTGTGCPGPPAAAAGDRPLALTQLQQKVPQLGLTFAVPESQHKSPGDICSVADVPLHRDAVARGTRQEQPCCITVGCSFAHFLPPHEKETPAPSAGAPGAAEAPAPSAGGAEPGPNQPE